MKKEKLTGIRIKLDNKPLSEQEQNEPKGWPVPKEQCVRTIKDSDTPPYVDFLQGEFFFCFPQK